jgi:hypothetical protein
LARMFSSAWTCWVFNREMGESVLKQRFSNPCKPLS